MGYWVAAVAVLVIVGVVVYFVVFDSRRKPIVTVRVEQAAGDRDPARDRYNDPDVKIIRDEIRGSVAQHKNAIDLLQALARIDGKTSEKDRDIIFDFLRRHAPVLQTKHREWFSTSRAGENYTAAGDETIDKLIYFLRDKPMQYRVDLVAAATAMVVGGGTPKKREAATLEKIRGLLVV
jgi:hypothetical protein